MTRPPGGPHRRLERRAFLFGLGGAAAAGPLPLFDEMRPAAGQAAPPADELQRELSLRRDEGLLLHRKVDLGGLRLFRSGRILNMDSPPVARLLVLHLWAVECRPCVEEFPLLRRITEALANLPHVSVALVCETADLAHIQSFLDDHRGDLPRAVHYQSTDERLRRSLQNRAQPATLLLDALSVVRQAFLGSLKQRRSEFADAIQRLARSV